MTATTKIMREQFEELLASFEEKLAELERPPETLETLTTRIAALENNLLEITLWKKDDAMENMHLESAALKAKISQMEEDRKKENREMWTFMNKLNHRRTFNTVNK